MLVRQVLFPVKPDVLGPLEALVFLAEQLAMLLPADLVHGLAHVLHDVETVVDDLARRLRHVLDRGLEVRFPHIHGHSPNPLELLRRELPVIVLETLGFPILGHKLHRAAKQVTDHGHVVMPLTEGLFIDAKIARGVGLLSGLPPPDGSVHDVPGLIPADPHEPAGAGHGGALAQHIDDQALHEQGEAPFGLGPRHFHLKHAVLRALHARNPGMEEGLELAGIEVTPYPGLGMITTSQFAATGRTKPPDTGSVININIHPASCRVQLDVGNKPRVAQPQNLGIQVRVLHGHPPGRTITGHLPTENPEGPENSPPWPRRICSLSTISA